MGGREAEAKAGSAEERESMAGKKERKEKEGRKRKLSAASALA
jgi:hypothetical protein